MGGRGAPAFTGARVRFAFGFIKSQQEAAPCSSNLCASPRLAVCASPTPRRRPPARACASPSFILAPVYRPSLTPQAAWARLRKLQPSQQLRAAGGCEATALQAGGFSRAVYDRWQARSNAPGGKG